MAYLDNSSLIILLNNQNWLYNIFNYLVFFSAAENPNNSQKKNYLNKNKIELITKIHNTLYPD